MKQKAPERQVSCRKKVKSMLHDAENQRGRAVLGHCLCVQSAGDAECAQSLEGNAAGGLFLA